MSTDKFNAAASGFRKRLSENSPLEAPVRGFNRYSRDMSPATRELVLRSRMPEIMSFAEDRRIDPAVVAGVVEASMRLGRIPDLGLYGLAGDEALAVKDFVAVAMLGLEHELQKGLPPLYEDKATQHQGYAAHYDTLAKTHAAAMKGHEEAAREANRAGRPFTAAKHQGQIAMLKQLHMSHNALADYHGCESERCRKDAAAQQGAVPTGAGPTRVDQPTGQPERPAHPQQGSTAAQRQEVPRHEATMSSAVGQIMKPLTGAFLWREPLTGLGGKRKRNRDDDEGVEFRHEHASDDGFFRRMPMMEDMIAEAEKADKKKKKDKKDKETKKKVKAPSKMELGMKDPDKVNLTIANAKMAALFQQLGHKMDHAEGKLLGKKVNDTWAKKLNKGCLSKGGPEAYHEVVKSSLAEPWIRDQGFVDEAAQLCHLWQTSMSAASETTVAKASPTSPEPMVFTINRMIDMSQGRGSIF